MHRHLETFFRHRVALLVPVVLSTGIALGIAADAQRTYTSSTTVRLDPSAAVVSSTQSLSAYYVSALDELLNTRAFTAKVGNPQASDVTVSAVGPHVVRISVNASDPHRAADIASAVETEAASELTDAQRSQAQSALDAITTALPGAAQAVTSADASVEKYLANHPALRQATALPDLTLTELQQEADQARQRYQTLLGKEDQANQNLAAAQSRPFTVIDPALVSTASVGLKKHLALAAAGGATVGLALLLVALLVLTWSDGSVRSAEEVPDLLGLGAAGTIPRLRRRRREHLATSLWTPMVDVAWTPTPKVEVVEVRS
jgi:uncharacterized protein involved in exopolysaccharide biosynthesis